MRLHLVHVNINGLPPKIEEMRDIAKRTKAIIIGISNPDLIQQFLIQKFALRIMKFFVATKMVEEVVF